MIRLPLFPNAVVDEVPESQCLGEFLHCQLAQDHYLAVWRKLHISRWQGRSAATAAQEALDAILESSARVGEMGVAASREGEAKGSPRGACRRGIHRQQLLHAPGMVLHELAGVDNEAVDNAPEAGAVLPVVLAHLIGRDQPRGWGRSAVRRKRQHVLRAQAFVGVITAHHGHLRETAGGRLFAVCDEGKCDRRRTRDRREGRACDADVSLDSLRFDTQSPELELAGGGSRSKTPTTPPDAATPLSTFHIVVLHFSPWRINGKDGRPATVEGRQAVKTSNGRNPAQGAFGVEYET